MSEEHPNSASHSRVLNALSGKQVLITGTTGFLGKVVLEKLIRSVPDIGGIHLLIRGNRHYPEARERFLEEIAASSVFERLRSEEPDRFEAFIDTRLHCVTGEITEPLFGLASHEFDALAAQLDAVINSAASVNFREELDKALAINTDCLGNICELSRRGGNLPVIQVSTCYVNGMNAGDAKEALVNPARSGMVQREDGTWDVDEVRHVLNDKIAELRHCYSGNVLAEKLVDLGIREANRYGWSDTYTFTKWMGEQVLMQALHRAPLTIVRPAIIESALAEPSPGWIEGVKVADAVILAYAREKVSLFPGRRAGIIDVIPADLVGNSIILSLAEAVSSPAEQRIYQCCSGATNPLRLGEMIDHVMTEARENHAAYDRLFHRQPTKPFIAVGRRLFDRVMGGVRLPLSLLDRVLKLAGSETELKALRNVRTTMELATIFGFYTAPDYVFHNDRLLELADRMGSRDQTLFPVDARLIDWPTYLRKIHLAGLNRFALSHRRLPRPTQRRKQNQRAA
ncbi:male sterility protein [Tamilnaduibacter salinus]|uniref:Male sterility protein n=1 Tax=Tamilnaduibacter salinus TaxID=1484056 RepID=A0A2U1D123_9GAMM|nr:fatty acyl-CoA reductase [Tamilnaduibacter salinus]PVY79008.1 male sterility protein [Tamilnaduibacter salinus]